MVEFSSKAKTPTGYNDDGRDCHSKRLADATPINIKYLKDFVDSLFARGTDCKPLLVEVFVISRISKVEVRVISRSRRLRLITP